MLKHVWDDSVPPLLREPALFDGNGLPRYWATIWSLYQTADLASSTKQKQLSYVESLYQFSESSSRPGALDDAIARVFFRVDEMEDYLAGIQTKLSDQSPFRLSSGDEIKPWDLMFLMPKRALAEGRNDGLCDITRYYSVGRFSPEMTMLSLSGKENDGYPTLFSCYGEGDEDRSLSLKPHSLRHLQNTELFRLGVADTIITKRFNRKSVAQSYEYDHRSLAEDLEQIELPQEVEIALGSKAATVARLIKAGKASGPIVEAFKKIQRTRGDDAAFEFLKIEADGFHSTPYGHCINSFTVDPCPKHLECFAGCRHLTATDMPKQRQHLIQLEGRFKNAMEAIAARPANTIGRDNQLIHAKNRLERVPVLFVLNLAFSTWPFRTIFRWFSAPVEKVLRPVL